MTHEQLIEKICAKTLALIGEDEKDSILQVLSAGDAFGYGNMIAWLATAWAVHLRDEGGLDAKTAIAAVSNRTPYPLPKPC